MPDTDPTPETPVTIRDALGWWRGESRAQLDQIIAALTAAGGAPDAAPIVAAIAAARGTAPYNDLAALHAKLETVRAAIANLSITNGLLADITAQLTTIQQVLGAGAYASTETGNVIALLRALVLNANRFGVDPDNLSGAEIASGTTLTSAGRRYVTWPANAGYSKSTDGTELTPVSGWSGWQVYIQSNASSARMSDITTPAASIETFSVNSWIDLGGSDTLAWSVDSQYNVSGVLRAPTVSRVQAVLDIPGSPGAWDDNGYKSIRLTPQYYPTIAHGNAVVMQIPPGIFANGGQGYGDSYGIQLGFVIPAAGISVYNNNRYASWQLTIEYDQ